MPTPIASGEVAELTGRKKNMLFAYSAYIEVLNRGTELALRQRPAFARRWIHAAIRSTSPS